MFTPGASLFALVSAAISVGTAALAADLTFSCRNTSKGIASDCLNDVYAIGNTK